MSIRHVIRGLKDSERTDNMKLALVCVFEILYNNRMDTAACTHL